MICGRITKQYEASRTVCYFKIPRKLINNPNFNFRFTVRNRIIMGCFCVFIEKTEPALFFKVL